MSPKPPFTPIVKVVDRTDYLGEFICWVCKKKIRKGQEFIFGREPEKMRLVLAHEKCVEREYGEREITP